MVLNVFMKKILILLGIKFFWKIVLVSLCIIKCLFVNFNIDFLINNVLIFFSWNNF